GARARRGWGAGGGAGPRGGRAGPRAGGGARGGGVGAAPRPAPRSPPAYLLKPSLLRTEQGLMIAAVCLTWPGKVILGEVRVKGSGGTPPDLVRALVPRLVQDASRTFDWDLKQ